MLYSCGRNQAEPAQNSAVADCAGYGFVSFGDNLEGAKALKEMNGRYVGNRPCKLSKSTWDVRAPCGRLNIAAACHAACSRPYITAPASPCSICAWKVVFPASMSPHVDNGVRQA